MERRLVLPSVPASVPRAVRFAEASARQAHLPRPLVDRLLLATGEAVANAIHHGNDEDPEKQVQLTWEAGADGWALTVEDERRVLTQAAFEQAHLPSDAMQTSGRGLYIMSELADAVEVRDGVLTLRFVIRDAERAA